MKHDSIVKNKFFTYAFPRTFSGINIPIPIQTTYLRDYAQRNKLAFSLPVAEIITGKSYYFLSNIFAEMKEGDSFGAVSILILPLFEESLLMEILSLIKFEHINLHFPLEGFVGNKTEIKKWINEYKYLNLYKSNFRNKLLKYK
jgi:sporadic carbohydrate cluster protein (TIGR04323 family)